MSAAHDAVAATLDEVADELDRSARDTSAVARRVRRLRRARAKGRSPRELFEAEPARSLLGRLASGSARLAAATGLLRRTVARALFEDGLRVGEIAQRLGVSHQRVSKLINHQGGEGSTATLPGPPQPGGRPPGRHGATSD